MNKLIRIAHLYPQEMNIYGDMGNIIALKYRLAQRGFQTEVIPIEVGHNFDFSNCDIIFGGGGQDSGQLHIGEDLIKRGDELRSAALDGLPMLTICGLYQMFGRGFITIDKREIQGISVFAASTTGSLTRMVGNIVVKSEKFGQLVGFENHSGQTVLESSQEYLGVVEKGFGNNEESKFEGAVSNNVIGTYLHGPILPKNPNLTDHLILQAVSRRHGIKELDPIDNIVEKAAAKSAALRPQ